MSGLIRKHKLRTAVLPHQKCASAYAAIWLAGEKRVMSKHSRIGFHAASLNGVEKGEGNAILGAHLRDLGLPLRAIQ
jgi:hypothetical protein